MFKDDLINIDSFRFEHIVHRIYPAELILIYVQFLHTYDKRDNFDFVVVNIPVP